MPKGELESTFGPPLPLDTTRSMQRASDGADETINASWVGTWAGARKNAMPIHERGGEGMGGNSHFLFSNVRTFWNPYVLCSPPPNHSNPSSSMAMPEKIWTVSLGHLVKCKACVVGVNIFLSYSKWLGIHRIRLRWAKNPEYYCARYVCITRFLLLLGRDI